MQVELKQCIFMTRTIRLPALDLYCSPACSSHGSTSFLFAEVNPTRVLFICSRAGLWTRCSHYHSFVFDLFAAFHFQSITWRCVSTVCQSRGTSAEETGAVMRHCLTIKFSALVYSVNLNSEHSLTALICIHMHILVELHIHLSLGWLCPRACTLTFFLGYLASLFILAIDGTSQGETWHNSNSRTVAL